MSEEHTPGETCAQGHFSMWTGGRRSWLPTLWLVDNHFNSCSSLHVHVKTWANTQTPETSLEPAPYVLNTGCSATALRWKSQIVIKIQNPDIIKDEHRGYDDYSWEAAPTLWATCFYSPEKTSHQTHSPALNIWKKPAWMHSSLPRLWKWQVTPRQPHSYLTVF